MTAGAANADTHRWQRVLAGESKVGHVELSRRQDGERIFESRRLQIELGRPGRHATYRMRLDTESAPDGALLRMTRDVKTREGHSLIEARVEGDDIVVTDGAGGSRSMQTFAGAARELKSDVFAQEWLTAVAHGEAVAPLAYKTWDPVKLAVTEVELRRLPDASAMSIERRVTSTRQVTATVQQLDAHGEVVRESMRFGALELTLITGSESEALAKSGMFDHVAGLLQKSPYRIPAKDMRAKIRYGFDNRGTAPQLPAGAGQRTWTDGQTTYMQVCAGCEPDPFELSSEERRQALQPTIWLQSDDSKIVRRARGIAAGATGDALKMRRLTTFVRDRMLVDQIDMLGYGTAVEAYDSGRGDCTEYAVLLAALGRAAGIPTRIAIGSVYARHFEGQRHVFVPHAWVQAFTGTGWQSFDAAIGSFDSTHLAFAVSYDGSPANHFAGATLAHELKLISAARVVPRKRAAN